jgi:O-6-methylguanine DNA methyltransferase
VNQQLALRNILGNLPFNVPFQVFHEPSSFGRSILASLRCIYRGQNVDASFPLTMTRLPSYTQRVLKATAQIPLGYVTSYSSIAKAVGGGPRAVGNIMAANPFAPIVPCHRVVKSDFGLGGYGGGLKVKVELLQREKRGFSASKEVEVKGGSYLAVFPAEYALKNLN